MRSITRRQLSRRIDITRVVCVTTWVGLLAMACAPSGQPGTHSVSASRSSPRAIHVEATPWRPWQHWRVERDHEPDIDVYVTHDDQPRPLVVMLAGSHCAPSFVILDQPDGKGKRYLSTQVFEPAAQQRPLRVHLAAVDRRYIKSFVAPSDGRLSAPCSRTNGGVSKQERVNDAAAVVVALARAPWVSRVIVLGHSEGADVAAGVSKLLGPRYVSAVGFFSSGGATQFYDHVVEARGAESDGDKRAQEVFDELLAITAGRMKGDYRGYPVERYRSYAVESTPLDDLRDSSIPVFIAHGTRDSNVPIESDDLLAAELLRQRAERPVNYVILQGLDHGYHDSEGRSHAMDVFGLFLDWALRDPPRRAVTTWRASSAGRD